MCSFKASDDVEWEKKKVQKKQTKLVMSKEGTKQAGLGS